MAHGRGLFVVNTPNMLVLEQAHALYRSRISVLFSFFQGF